MNEEFSKMMNCLAVSFVRDDRCPVSTRTKSESRFDRLSRASLAGQVGKNDVIPVRIALERAEQEFSIKSLVESKHRLHKLSAKVHESFFPTQKFIFG